MAFAGELIMRVVTVMIIMECILYAGTHSRKGFTSFLKLKKLFQAAKSQRD